MLKYNFQIKFKHNSIKKNSMLNTTDTIKIFIQIYV